MDLTSNTQVSAYETLGVPEIWRLKEGKLEINLLNQGKYVSASTSLSFPSIPAVEGISLFLENSMNMPMSAVRREFRQWVLQQL
ncbi:hypothetical protein V2H45_18710 [Tumidithrix elongata RA019]|uniref:Restriction endonuclease domain-containing protein n=1 Tax=Tumidithrix elongata BACA0141 TaxID=2716417 RepID=A0AAW9Q6C9_9CYAN|nr:hypothetical protein [Tumidithrix elongata RA019]